MTLIVSLRIPDGIVIAGDSLSTASKTEELDIKIDAVCPHCEQKHNFKHKMPIPNVPVTTFSYAQKVIPFYDKFGVGTFGAGLLANQSVYFATRLMEQRFKNEKTEFEGVAEVTKQIGDEIHNLLKKQLGIEKKTLDNLPPNKVVIGLQVVGYDGTEPKTVEVSVGREVKISDHIGLGFTASGSNEIVIAISKLYENKSQMPPYQLFSLQDAIDYAEFLISTTIAHQQFSQRLSKVGGDIDIALVTPFDGFQWIRQKHLGKILEEK